MDNSNLEYDITVWGIGGGKAIYELDILHKSVIKKYLIEKELYPLFSCTNMVFWGG